MPPTQFENAGRYFAAAGAVFCISGYDNEADGCLTPEERSMTSGACTKRFKEFSMGRLLARRALSSLNHAPAPILTGPQKEPLWPAGIVGSISHTNTIYAVVAAQDTVALSLGLDIEGSERWISDGAFRLICRPEERPLLKKCALKKQHARIALFSAKESLYKLLYPLTRRRFSFDGARIIAASPDHFLLELTADLSPAFPAGWHTKIAIFTEPGHILTGGALGASSKP